MPLTFAETPLYYRDSQGQYHRILSGADMTAYRTAAAQDVIDAAQDAEIGIVITGKRPSIAATAGQYVIVRNSTISGITDGLYTANAALSPSTDVTAANLSAVSNGGLNDLNAKKPTIQNTVGPSTTISGNSLQRISVPVTTVSGFKASGILGITSVGIVDVRTLFVNFINQTAELDAYNPSSSPVTITPIFVCLYLPG